MHVVHMRMLHAYVYAYMCMNFCGTYTHVECMHVHESVVVMCVHMHIKVYVCDIYAYVNMWCVHIHCAHVCWSSHV